MPLNFDLLPDKPQAQKQRSLNFDLLPDKPPRKSLFPQISPEEQVKHPVLTGIAETGRDVLAPGFHFANQLLLDYPRRITEHLGYEYPSGNESGENVLGLMKRKPVAGTLAGIAGVAGGIKNPIFNALGGGFGAGLGKNVLAGAATGAAYSPSKFESPGQVAGEQITKAIGGAALPMAGKAISKVVPMVKGFGTTVVSKGAGLSKTAMDTVSRLGFKKVREVADKGVNYIQEDVIPRARQSLIKNITSAGDASKELLQDMGFNPDQIKSVMKISKQNMNKYGKMVSESWVKTEKNLGKALTNVGKQIGEVYTKAAKEGQKINIKNTLGTMRKQLRGLGVVDDAGNLLGDYKTHPSSAVRNLAQIYSEYAPRVGKGDISVPDFFNFRTRLQASIVKFPEGEKFNVPIYITNKVLKEDSINSLIQKGSPYEKFWRDLNKEYSDLETLDYLTKKITTVANNLPNKILTQRNKLTEKHMKLYGKDIVSDVDAYNAARELYPEKETFSVFNPQKQLIREAYKRTEMLKEAVKPVTEPIGRTAQKAGQWGANRVQQYMEAPLVSPKIKSFFAQAPGQAGAKLKGKSGQAIFGKEGAQKPVFGAKPQEALKTVADVEKMISEKSKVYGSRNGFLASDEYKKLYPQVEKIYAENKNNFVSKASKALEENNIKIGDRVSTLAQGFSGGESVSGTVISKEGIPYVKLDSPQMTQGGYKKQVQWHKGWRKSQELTPTPIQKPIAPPAKDLQGKPGIVEPLTAAEAVKGGMRDIPILTSENTPRKTSAIDGVYLTPDRGYASDYADGLVSSAGHRKQINPNNGTIITIKPKENLPVGYGDVIDSLDKQTLKKLLIESGVDEFTASKLFDNPKKASEKIDWRVAAEWMQNEMGYSEVVVDKVTMDDIIKIETFKNGKLISSENGNAVLGKGENPLYTGTPYSEKIKTKSQLLSEYEAAKGAQGQPPQGKPGIVEGKPLTAAEAVKQGMGAEEFVKTKYGIAEEDVLYHGTNLPKGEKIEYVEPRIGDFTRTMYAGAGEGTFEEMGGKPLAYYKTHKDINKIKQYATGVAVYPKKGEPYILLTKRPGDALLVKEDGLYDTRGDIVTRDIPLGAENGDIISEESSRILAQIPLKKYNQLLSEYEAAKKAQGKGTALGLAGLTAAGTAMAGQAQAEEEKTLGQKNNNPINLKAFDKWDGMTGKDAQGHAVFKDLDYGIRANLKNLYNHQRKHPEQTLAQYLNTFAEANSDKEAAFIAKKLGITTDAKLKTTNMDDIIIPLAEFESKTKLTKEDIARVKKKFNF